MYTYRATVVLATNHLHRATSELRSELHRKVVADDKYELPDWGTLSVAGPIETFDPRGEIRFEYRGSVQLRSDRERLAARR